MSISEMVREILESGMKIYPNEERLLSRASVQLENLNRIDSYQLMELYDICIMYYGDYRR